MSEPRGSALRSAPEPGRGTSGPGAVGPGAQPAGSCERSAAGPVLEGLAFGVLLWLVALAIESAFDGRLVAGSERVGPLADRHHIEMGAIYAGYVREAFESGALAMHDSQTAVSHAGTLLRPWEWALGRGLAALGGGAEQGLAAERIAALLLVGVASSLLMSLCTASSLRRRIGTAALLFGGNLFWLVELAGRRSGLGEAARGWLNDVFPRLSGQGFSAFAVHLGVPHLALELGCFALVVLAGVHAARRRSLAAAAATGVLALALACVRPYTLPAALTAAGAAWLPLLFAGSGAQRARAVAAVLLLGLPSLPYAWHVSEVLASDTPFSKLNVLHPAPAPGELLTFLGAFAWAALPLAALAWSRRRTGKPGVRVPKELLAALWGWGLVELALVQGEPWIAWEVEAALPLGTLAVVVCVVALEALPGTWGTGILAALAGLGFAGSAGWTAELLERAGSGSDPLLISVEERAAFEFLESDRAGPLSSDDANAVLLCSSELSVLAPWLAGVRAYRGHPDHVLEPRVLQERQRAALRGLAQVDAVRRGGVTHVLSGPRERALGALEVEAMSEYLGSEPAFESGAVAVWRLDRPDAR